MTEGILRDAQALRTKADQDRLDASLALRTKSLEAMPNSNQPERDFLAGFIRQLDADIKEMQAGKFSEISRKRFVRQLDRDIERMQKMLGVDQDEDE